MNIVSLVILIIFIATIIVQALRPQCRLLAVLVGAAISSVVATSGDVIEMSEVWKEIPWNVIAILVFLGLSTHALLPSNVLGCVAVKACAWSRGREIGLLITFPGIMFLLSGVVNNLTAMLVVMPILLTILKVLGPRQAFVNILLSSLLVSCNIGGCSFPLGDFPAILLLGSGKITLTSYFIRAWIACAIIFLVVQSVLIFCHWRKARQHASLLEQHLAVETIHYLHRRMNIRWRVFIPIAVAFMGMVIAWIAGLAADLVAFVGIAVILTSTGVNGESVIRNGFDAEPVLFLVGLFVMIVIIDATGVLNTITVPIFSLEASPRLMICAFLILAGVLTGVFSAGPSMAALLPLAERMTVSIPSDIVYVSLALSVCAGSSLFLTAATSGPLAQCQVECAAMLDENDKVIQFGFCEFLRYGLISFLIILSGAIFFALLSI
jgi:Na+/H+ antiporter NhaD/arsenite permease-like protein